MTTTIDWPAVIATCGSTPTSQLGAALAPLVGGEVVLWVWDHQRRHLSSLGHDRRVDVAGASDLVEEAPGWAVLSHLGDDLGLMTLGVDDLAAHDVEALATLVTASVVAGDRSSDTVDRRRRTREMSLPAELQWSLLPPSALTLGPLDISAAIEPAYDTGGDIFDYAVHGDTLFLGVLDARGHGLRAAMTSAVAASAMRRARRQGLGLVQIAAEIDAAIGAIGDPLEFVTAALVELDLRTWRGTWLGAGHRAPLRITADATSALPTVPCLPLGMTIAGQRAQPELQPVALDEGDMLVLYSDGVIDNLRGPDAADDAPAEAAFHAALRTDPGASHRARSVVESLLARSSELRDDATLLLASRRP